MLKINISKLQNSTYKELLTVFILDTRNKIVNFTNTFFLSPILHKWQQRVKFYVIVKQKILFATVKLKCILYSDLDLVKWLMVNVKLCETLVFMAAGYFCGYNAGNKRRCTEAVRPKLLKSSTFFAPILIL